MRFLSPVLVRLGAVLFLMVLGLSACVVVEDDSGPGGPIGPGPLCERNYDPVCARRGGDRRTFANACLADESGYRIVRRGECRRDDGDYGGGGGGGGQQYCTQEYDPVCARRGGDRRTFSNSCRAEQAGYRIIGEGECRRRDDDDNGGGGGGRGDDDRACTREYAPVCALWANQRRTFPNRCEADRAGFRVFAEGECR